MILVVWLGSLLWNTPILVVSRRQAMRQGKHKCREVWPSPHGERAYNLFLDVMLLLIPLVIMTLAYSLIVSKLWKGLRREIRHHSSCRRQLERTSSSATMNEVVTTPNDVGTCDSLNGNIALATPTRQHRVTITANHQHVLAPRAGPAASVQCNTRKANSRSPSAVKLWLLKGMVQVKQNGSRSDLSRSRSSPIIATAANTSGPLPETSRLIAASSALPSDGHHHLQSQCEDQETPTHSYTFSRHVIRSNYMDKSIEAKKKVIRMLFVIIVEFFVCWAPLHVLNTWYLFSPDAVYTYVGSTGVSLVQLLAYISSCCNPITYCFMNRKFRQAFIGVFDCQKCSSSCWWYGESQHRNQHGSPLQRVGREAAILGGNNSDISANDSTMFVGRTMPRSVMVLEGEDRV